MDFARTPETIALNEQLQVVSLKGLVFKTHKGLCRITSGYGLFIPGKGFIKFRHDSLAVPYSPKRKVLTEIVEAGGFLEYETLQFVNSTK